MPNAAAELDDSLVFPLTHGSRSNRHAVTIELVVLIIAALASAEVGEVVHELDGRDPLDHLEAQLVLTSQS